ncbi:PH domain-containing protein [Streptacidiphilus sp. P02-A3a]|nr:PH domain-containing protein [Streptacidiphilus sp. P02-A3a]QMU70301.1 PH domain-containing protein [Streptacidiphilus sp. P02-A3a]
MFGVTELAPEGMRLRTLVSRRRIPWSDVTMVEAQRRSGRGGSWWVVRVHLLHGRPVVLPGAMQSQRGQNESGFRTSVDTICSHWRQATGRTDQPVYKD